MFEFYNKINDPSLNGAIFIAVCRGKVGCSYKTRNRGDLVIHIIDDFRRVRWFPPPRYN
jgi:hypothetical protein